MEAARRNINPEPAILCLPSHSEGADMTDRIERISSPHVAEPPPERWSNALRVGSMLYVSGMVSRANDGKTIQGKGEYEQARIIFQKIRHLVEAAGGGMPDIVKMIIYVVDIRNNVEVWRARREFFLGDFPVSTLVQVAALGTPEVLVEIEVIAHLGAGRKPA
jgi:2-iminobutanoate/2-iminopropanoate deaminase